MEIQKSPGIMCLHGVKGDYLGKHKMHIKKIDRRICAENKNTKEKRKKVSSSALFNFQSGCTEIHA